MPNKNARIATVTVAVTMREKGLVQILAKRDGLSVSEWVRGVILDRIAEVNGVDSVKTETEK